MIPAYLILILLLKCTWLSTSYSKHLLIQPTPISLNIFLLIPSQANPFPFNKYMFFHDDINIYNENVFINIDHSKALRSDFFDYD